LAKISALLAHKTVSVKQDYFPKQKYALCLSKGNAGLITRSTIMYITDGTLKASKIYSEYFLKQN